MRRRGDDPSKYARISVGMCPLFQFMFTALLRLGFGMATRRRH